MTYLNIRKKPVVPGITLLIFSCTVIFFSCRKNNETTHENIFNAPAAKEWFYATFKKTNEYATATAGRQLPDWKTGRYKKTGSMEMVEYNLVQQKKTAIFAPTGNQFEDKRIAEAAISKALFVKKGNETSLYIIQFMPGADYAKANGYDISKNSFTSPDKNLTGKLLVKNWNNELVKGYNIENGKKISLIKQIKQENITGRSTSNSDCNNIYNGWFEQWCDYDPVGDNITVVSCGEWELLSVTLIESNCPIGATECELLGLDQEACMCQVLGVCNGGGGEEEEEACANINLDTEINNVETVDHLKSSNWMLNGPNERTVRYEWTFVQSYSGSLFQWLFSSIDDASHKKINNEWRFDTLTHVKEQKYMETNIAFVVECRDVRPLAHIGIYHASMRLDYTIYQALICRGSPINRERGFNSTKFFAVNETP